MGEVVDEDGGAFAHGEDGVFVQGGVGGEDAFGESLHHCAGEGEVLFAVGRLLVVMSCGVDKRGRGKRKVKCEGSSATRPFSVVDTDAAI